MFDLFRRKQNLKYAKPGRAPPDPALFPQYFQNEQCMWCHFSEWWPRGVPLSECRGVIFIVSGLGEHSGRYDAVAQDFNREGFVVFSQDNQGAGGSEGLRTYVDAFDDFVGDVRTFIDYIIRTRYAEEMKVILADDTRKLFLLGHSMGGLIAALVAQSRPKAFGGVILSGPAFKSPLEPSGCMKQVLRFLAWSVPKLRLAHLDDKLHLCSSNPPVYELLVQDPYYAHEYMRAHFLSVFFKASTKAFAQMEHTSFPLLIVHGEKDGLCGLSGSRRFLEEAVSIDKQMKTYPDAKHEILTDVCRLEVMKDILDFIHRIQKGDESTRGE